MKLSKLQNETLEVLKSGPRSAYPGLKLNTLESLYKRGLVSRKGGLGDMWSPQTAITWKLTEAGEELTKVV